jgi:hypothetical protein
MNYAIQNYVPLVMIIYKTFDGSIRTYAIKKKDLKNFVNDVNKNKVVLIPSEDVALHCYNIQDYVEPETDVEKLVYMQNKDTRNRLIENDIIKHAKVKPKPIEFVTNRISYYNDLQS